MLGFAKKEYEKKFGNHFIVEHPRNVRSFSSPYKTGNKTAVYPRCFMQTMLLL